MPAFENWGDYWWPGQYEECLRNILHETVTGGREIHEPDELERHERQLTTIRAAQLISDPHRIEQSFTPAHYHALHRWLFQDVYAWAGQPRVVTTLKGDSQFADPADIDRLLGLVHQNLGDPARLRTAPRTQLIDTLTRTLTGLIMIHPHLEGNGRTSRLYLQQIAARAGHAIDWTQIPPAQLVAATIAAFKLEPDALHAIMQRIVQPLTGPERTAEFRQRMQHVPPPGTAISTDRGNAPPQSGHPQIPTSPRRPEDPGMPGGLGHGI